MSSLGTAVPRFVAALLGLFLLAALYDWALRLMPIAELSPWLPVALAGAVFSLASWTIVGGHLRNREVAPWVTPALAIFAVGSTYFWAARGVGLAEWFRSRMTDGIQVDQHSVRGPMMLALWALELGTVVFLAMYFIKSDLEHAYCERCAKWMTTRRFPLMGVERARVESLLGQADFDRLVSLEIAPKLEGNQVVVLALSTCSTCTAASLSAFDVVLKSDAHEDRRELIVRDLQLPLSPSQHLAARIQARDAATSP